MKIILDARKIQDYGIGVYVENLFQGIIDSKCHECRVLHLRGTQYPQAPEGSFVEVSFKNYDPREHLEVPIKIRRLKDFRYFSPHYVSPLFLKNRLIVTVHDLIHFRFPHLFRPAIRVTIGRFFMEQVRKKAEVIFTVSNTTRDDLVELFGVREDRIRVVYNGISDVFFREPRQAPPFSFPYILYVGNLKPHKNLPVLLRAFSSIKDRYSHLRLLLVGAEPGKAFMRMKRDLRLEERVECKPYSSHKELIRILDGAEFFVFPSLYEGFGFPPLEAMARRKAVISSSGGSLREVLGQAALFFDPNSDEELAEKISRFLDDEGLRKTYEEKGYIHSSSFRWQKTTHAYLDILEEIE
ncbi:MAG: glycosyltransferase family 4 protein [Candidatus Aminicenantales bacterium]